MTDPATTLPVLYLPHGGGPLPLLGDPQHQGLSDWLVRQGEALPRPELILVVSAHWEAPRPTLTAAPRPELIYDYYGFPAESYQLRYPAPGAPAWAETIASQLRAEGFDAVTDPARGFDHGLFVPLTLLRPAADVPCLQLSLLAGLDPASHIRLGEALAPLRSKGVLILGSGMSFHNLPALLRAAPAAAGEAFDRWLADTCCDPALTPGQRRQRLIDWEQAPHARFCHPREEHLLPLHLCCGAAELQLATSPFCEPLMGQRCRALRWD